MIQLYCGDGKGKTSAAVGAAVRAAGRGKEILFAQFMKGQESGELYILERLRQVRIVRSDRVFPFYRQMTQAQKEELLAIHNRMLDEIAAAQGEMDFVVLDEITHAARFRLVDEEKLGRILDWGKGTEREIILTGRGPSDKLIAVSDYISEIRMVRHPYQKGVQARYGVEL